MQYQAWHFIHKYQTFKQGTRNWTASLQLMISNEVHVEATA